MTNTTLTPPALDFRLLFEAAPDAALVLTPDLTIVVVSDVYLRLTFTERQALLGRPFFDTFPDTPAASTATRMLRESLNRVQVHHRSDTVVLSSYDVGHIAIEGRGLEARSWRLVNAPVLSPSGKLAYIMQRVEDVTEAVAITHARADAEAAISFRDQFVANVALDLRCNVAALLGFVDMVRRRLAENQSPDLDLLLRTLSIIHQIIKASLWAIDQLRHTIQIDSGQFTLDLQATDVGQFVSEIVTAMQAERPQHRLDLSVCGDTQASIDRFGLRTVMTNLVTHAVERTSKGTPIQIEVDGTAPPILRISIMDQGHTIRAEERGRIFERFYCTYHQEPGPYISQAIVRLHGGHLAAEFPDAGGLCMVISLPRSRARSADAE